MDNESFQDCSVAKRADASFRISHNGLPYNVCSREVDPANLYDINEVRFFWESLPDDDPRKQHEPEPEPAPEASPVEYRSITYVSEADELFRQAQFYEAEARGFELLGILDAAQAATLKSEDFYKQYALKKQEIRERFPDADEETT